MLCILLGKICTFENFGLHPYVGEIFKENRYMRRESNCQNILSSMTKRYLFFKKELRLSFLFGVYHQTKRGRCPPWNKVVNNYQLYPSLGILRLKRGKKEISPSPAYPSPPPPPHTHTHKHHQPRPNSTIDEQFVCETIYPRSNAVFDVFSIKRCHFLSPPPPPPKKKKKKKKKKRDLYFPSVFSSRGSGFIVVADCP